MKPIIEIIPFEISKQKCNTVDARDLHNFLEVETRFDTWFHRRAEEYGFSVNIDFCSTMGGSSGGRPAALYFISIDMAKELSMVERNDKGKEARKYFIECERIAKDAVKNIKIPETYAEALRVAADQAEHIEYLEEQKIIDAPKVEFATIVEGSEGCLTIGEFAKLSGNIGRNALFAELRGRRILMSSNVPYQRYVDAGYFSLTEKETQGGLKSITLVTGKGQLWLSKKIDLWA